MQVRHFTRRGRVLTLGLLLATTALTPAARSTPTSARAAASASDLVPTTVNPSSTANGTTTPYTLTTSSNEVTVGRTAALQLQSRYSLAASPADSGPAPTITSVTFAGSADNPTITINGSGFGSAPAAQAPGCYSGGAVYGADLSIVDDNPSHSFQAGYTGNCIGLVNLSYSDTQVSYQFGNGYSGYRSYYTLG